MFITHDLPESGRQVFSPRRSLEKPAIPVSKSDHQSGSHILIVHDCATERDCIARALAATCSDLHVTACATRTVVQVSELPDLVVLFVDEIGPDGDLLLRHLRPIRSVLDDVPYVVVTGDEQMQGASADLFRLGASGCMSHTTGLEGLAKMLWLVLHGGVCFPRESMQGTRPDAVVSEGETRQADPAEPVRELHRCEAEIPDEGSLLTKREAEVVQKLRLGKPNKIIAYELGISISTVKVHLRNIMRKTGATNRVEAALRAGTQAGRHMGSLSLQR